LEPVFSILLAAALLGELLKPIQSLGIALVLTAIVIVQRPAKGSAVREESACVEPME
jgi:drug/metabolite transporter (DMT)-like permease